MKAIKSMKQLCLILLMRAVEATTLPRTAALLVFFAAATHCCYSQDAKAEMNRISQQYLAFESFETRFDYLLYSDDNFQKKLENQSGAYYKSGTKSCMKGLQTETITDEQYSVTVNHQQKMILANRTSEAQKENPDMGQVNILADLLEKEGRMSLKKTDGSTAEITISYGAGEYSMVKLVYDTKTYMLKELHMKYRDTEGLHWTYKGKPYLVIRYHHTRTNHKISDHIFDIKRLVIINGKNVKPTAALSGYEVFTTI